MKVANCGCASSSKFRTPSHLTLPPARADRAADCFAISPVGAERTSLLRRQRNDGAEGGILSRRCLLKWKIHDPCLFQVEFAFHAPARFIGDLALLQQPVDVFALSGDQFRP